MLFKCLTPGAEIPGRFPGPVHARGKWFTIDIHCHVRSDKAAAMVEGNTTVSQWFLETAASERSRAINRHNGERTRLQGSSPEQRIEDMDRMGIDIQAISPSPRQTYYGADPDLGRETSRAVNDLIAEICGRYPDRFVGLGTVPFQAPDLAIAELERLHKSLGFRGIEIMTHVAGEDLSADRFRKIFARCEELGLVVFMHPDGFTEASRFADHYFANVIGNPLDSTVALHHLIFGGVLRDYPTSSSSSPMAAVSSPLIRVASITPRRPARIAASSCIGCRPPISSGSISMPSFTLTTSSTISSTSMAPTTS